MHAGPCNMALLYLSPLYTIISCCSIGGCGHGMPALKSLHRTKIQPLPQRIPILHGLVGTNKLPLQTNPTQRRSPSSPMPFSRRCPLVRRPKPRPAELCCVCHDALPAAQCRQIFLTSHRDLLHAMSGSNPPASVQCTDGTRFGPLLAKAAVHY